MHSHPAGGVYVLSGAKLKSSPDGRTESCRYRRDYLARADYTRGGEYWRYRSTCHSCRPENFWHALDHMTTDHGPRAMRARARPGRVTDSLELSLNPEPWLLTSSLRQGYGLAGCPLISSAATSRAKRRVRRRARLLCCSDAWPVLSMAETR